MGCVTSLQQRQGAGAAVGGSCLRTPEASQDLALKENHLGLLAPALVPLMQ